MSISDVAKRFDISNEQVVDFEIGTIDFCSFDRNTYLDMKIFYNE